MKLINILKFIGIISFISAIGFLTFPLPSYFFNQSKDFSSSKPISFISDKQNKEQRCSANTVYYSESNLYTESGEGIVNPFCSKLHKELKVAIEKNDVAAVKQLLSQGANVNSPNNDYDLLYPIVVAVRERNSEIVKLLLDSGANANQIYTCCMSSTSILMMSVKNNDLKTAELLLSRGANLSFESEYDGYDVFDVASENSNYEMFKLIDNACGINLLHRAELRYKLLISWIT